MKTNKSTVAEIIRNTSGRFFGVETANGSVFNARLVKETPSMFVLHDRNTGTNRRILKDQLYAVSFKGHVVFA